MDKWNYQAAFIDIDGTLIKSDHSISPATADCIRQVLEKKVLVVLVSARPMHGILPIAPQIGLTLFPIASLNGGYIAKAGEMIFESVINLDLISKVHEKLSQYAVTPIYYEETNWYAEAQNPATDKEQLITDVPLTISPFDDMMSGWQKRNTGPAKILVIGDPIVVSELESKLKIEYQDQLNIYTSKPPYLEIMGKGASKLDAVKLVSKQFGIDKENVIAIGDNFNDQEMIAYAGMGIAMGNAPDEVKAIADYVTDTNNNDGVAKALTKFVLE